MSDINLDPKSLLDERLALEIDKLFRTAAKLEASHLHLKVGRPPFVRINAVLHPLKCDPVDDDEMASLIFPMIDADKRRQAVFQDEGGVDFAYTVTLDGVRRRFRVNVMQQSGHVGMVAHLINNTIPDFAHLHLPPLLADLCGHTQGMILLAGTTSCGKSTTIASMLDYINHRQRRHVLTLEDPVEFIFTDDKCVFNQREIGLDVRNFVIGMKQAVREDPDVMMVGEMRDRETFETAIQAAETGHLVFGTIHASTAPSTIGRILDLFPYDLHPALRNALVLNMKAIIAQKLLPSILPGVARVPACEIMIFTPMIRKLLLDGQDDKLPDAIRIGKEEGMQDFTMVLCDLVQRQMIDHDAAFEVAPNPAALKMALKGLKLMESAML